MPIYEFKCDCGARREVKLPFSESRKGQRCKCGQMMRRQFSLYTFTMPKTGRDKVLDTLNREEDAQAYPGGEMHSKRYDEAMAKGLDQTRPVIGRGI